MKLKVLTAVFDPREGVFNDDAIQAFQENHDVIDAQSQFFHHDGCPVWTVLVRYRGAATTSTERRDKRDWRAALDDPGKTVFDRIKAWRADRAKKDGVSAFLILTNRQLATIVQRQPKSVAELRDIDGIGEKTAERYGQQILAFLEAPTKQEAQK